MESRSGLNILDQGDLPSLVHSDIPTFADEVASSNVRVLSDVEITPAKMIFNDAYEGKEFVKKLTILNKGKRTATVRICSPSAKSFIIRPMLKIRRLPPGLSITRTLRFKYNRAYSIHDATLPIFINNDLIEYSLTVYLNQPRIIVEPTEVNFGRIDAVSSVVTKTVVVKNEGTKNCSYVIDLGRNELELIVEPVKGVLQAWESVRLRLEVMGFYEGPFEKEFWIKTAPPKRVKVIGEFIMPKIVPTFPKAYCDFSMVNFPRIYVGQQATRTLMVKNISSTDIMFCIMALGPNGTYINIEEAKNINANFLNFHINPIEGRLDSQQISVVEINFKPLSNSDDYALCFLHVIRVDYSEITDPILLKEKKEPTCTITDRSRSSLMALATSLRAEQNPSNDKEDDNPLMVTEERISQFDSFRVCLYGDLEVACVRLTPSSICLNEIIINETYSREVMFENDSSYLPITVSYVKTACINVEPEQVFIKPKETKEVLLRVKPTSGGAHTLVQVFNLIAYENKDCFEEKKKIKVVGTRTFKVSYVAKLKKVEIQPKLVKGITPNITNEVGMNTNQICFGTKNVEHLKSVTLTKKPKWPHKYDNALIAFPNDRPKSIRPWTHKQPCLTLFAKIPRAVSSHDEYGLSTSKQNFKAQNEGYFTTYLRNQQKMTLQRHKNNKVSKSFDLCRKELFKKFACDEIEVKRECSEKVTFNHFFPLSPLQLYNVKISKKYIRLQRVAPVSNVECQFTIKNNNAFPIFVYLTAVKPGIRFPQGYYKIVKSLEEKAILMTCFAGIVGRYINLVQVIINFSHIHTISIMVDVVPKLINVGVDSITMEVDDPTVQYLELKNNLNSSISFSWDVSYSRFKIFPQQGTISQKHAIICAVQYESVPDMPDYSELVLTSEGGGSQLVQISRKKRCPNIEIFPPALQLPVLPANIKTCHTILIRNMMSCDISFIVTDPSPLEGVNIEPTEGTIHEVGCMILYVWIQIETAGSLNATLEILFEDAYTRHIKIEGNVLLPSIEIKPETIVNRQMIPFAYKRNVFFVRNVAAVDCWIKFNMDDYESFTINEDELFNEKATSNENFKLLPGEGKKLFLHFNPKESCTDNFYIPIVLNNFFGPPLINNAESMRSVFLPASDGQNSPLLPLLKITSIVTNVLLSFSSLKLNFFRSDSVQYQDAVLRVFSVTNVGTKEAAEFCIRIEMIAPEFQITYKGGPTVIESPFSMRCKLEPGETVQFNIRFKPLTFGEHNVNLPIFVRGYHEGSVFNYLCLKGIYQKPVISSTKKDYFLEPVPVCFRNIVRIPLSMSYHKENCYLSLDPPNLEVSIKFQDERSGSRRTEIRTKISVVMNRPGSLVAPIRYFCSCEGSCIINLHCCADDSFMTHHAFVEMNRFFFVENLVEPVKIFQTPSPSEELVQENINDFENPMLIKISSSLNYVSRHVDHSDYPECWNQHNFPYFPSKFDKEHEAYSNYLNSTLRYVENWISSQCFYKTLYLDIPQIISLVPWSSMKNNKKQIRKGASEVPEPFLIIILTNLAGTTARDLCLTSKPSTNKQMDIALHFFTTYQNILNYLRKEGALLPHVFPEFLLNYNQYTIIHTYLPELLQIEDCLNQELFSKLSTQCYLDVLLQSIKIFILNNLKMFETNNILCTSKCLLDDGEKTYSEYSLDSTTETLNIFRPNAYVYNNKEHMLLYWLYYHYEKQKYNIWEKEHIGDEIYDLTVKDLKTFDEDLEDSLVFSSVTVSYCPYLKDFLRDMYISCSTTEEYHHNACKLISAWQLLKLSYKIEPMDIVKPNPVNMLLLTMYLYEVLPSFYPKEEIEMEAKLTLSSVATITIQNTADHNILYSVGFFKNEHQCFTCENQLFKIGAKKTSSIKITYQARKITSQQAILVLSGELPGQRYTRTRVIHLHGITDLHNPTKQETLKVECYKIHYLSIELFSPYNVPDEYEIFYKITAPKEPKVFDASNLCSWREYIEAKIPKRMYTKKPNLSITNPHMGCKFEPIVCCTVVPVRVYTMFLVGKYGDWSFEITILPKMSRQNHEVIEVSLPRGFNQQICTCKEKVQSDISLICPRTIHISVPCKNNLFYKSLREMFIACTHEQYFAFWKKYLPIRTVFNILKLLFLSDKSAANLLEYKEVFKKSQTFNVYADVNSPYQTVRQLTIEDVTSEMTTEMLIHAGPDFETHTETSYIEMEAVSGMEIRYYKLSFFEC